ncbi:MAG: glycosyltransferase [Candidatus Poribacteria bacterium]|nr:glycosyltransferase [Candidatus Poribacteria bacterium]
MRIAISGGNYCGQYLPIPEPHEGLLVPCGPTLAEMFAAVDQTPDWADALVFVLVESLPMPSDLEDCPCPVVGIVIDWEAWSDSLFAHAPALDYILSTQAGVEVLGEFFPGKLKAFVGDHNFSGMQRPNPCPPFAERPHDVTFIGNFFPTERFQGRNRGLNMLYRLADRFDVRIMAKLSHEDYLAAVTDSKMLFNHAATRIQHGVNARNFETAVCGALLMGETYNPAIRQFLEDDELLLYDENTLADSIQWALDHPDEAQRRIDKAHPKLTGPLMPRLLAVLEEIVAAGRRAAREMCTTC